MEKVDIKTTYNPVRKRIKVFVAVAGVCCPIVGFADGGVTFTNVAEEAEIEYSRNASPAFNEAVLNAKLQSLTTPLVFEDLFTMPQGLAPLAGVAILDYDKDGDLDMYVSNGLGTANSLFSSQLVETGNLTFIDKAHPADIAAIDHDSAGVCYGDIDNDGYHDMLVLGANMPNRLYVNNGDGAFSYMADSVVGGGSLGTSSCAMGDINGDGLLDIVVANTFDVNTGALWNFVEPFAFNTHNQLFINTGDNAFTDVSATSGIQNLTGFPPGFEGSATVTWAVSIIDVDLDGDADIVFADDQGAIPKAKNGGLDRGFVHVFDNDGSGQFSDRPVALNTESASEWMGLSFGDLNCDGNMDIFGSNFGDYGLVALANPLLAPYQLGDSSSRWLLGNGDGSFTDPGVGDLVATPFGWGSGVFDYDNDGDQDIIYHGGLDLVTLVISDNPGAVLQNQDCSANFIADTNAITTNHLRRDVRGMAVGDLDQNGFTDIVTVGQSVMQEPIPLVPVPVAYGSTFDATALIAPLFFPTPEGGFVWSGLNTAPGDLAVELNDGANENNSVSVTLQGSIGIARKGRVNRDGIGAVVSFKPVNGKKTMVPVLGGSSYLSQNSLQKVLGLGSDDMGRLDVLWPGGVRNRLYSVMAGERITMPEIPCSIDTDMKFSRYLSCVDRSLGELEKAGVINSGFKWRLYISAVIAFFYN